WFAAAVLFGSMVSGMAVLGDDPPAGPKADPKAKAADKPPPDADITKDVRAWNSDKFASPPTQFRQGHTTPRQLDPKAITKKTDGFAVQLPSGAPIPTPSVCDGKVFVSGGFHSREFYCLDAKTGALVWAIDLDDDGPTAAACADGVCVFNTESCTLFAVDAKTGQHLWSHWLGDPLTSTPTIANGVVYTSYPAMGGGGMPNQGPNANAKPAPAADKAHPPCSHVLVALELKTGKILWQRWLDSDVMTAPVAVDKEVYAASFSGVVYRFNQADGEILSAVRTRATSAPTVVGKNVYFTRRTDDGKSCKEAVNTVDRGSNAVLATGEPREAVWLDVRVQQGGNFAAAAQKLDAGNGFGGGAPMQANPKAAEGNVGYGNVSSMQAFQGSRVLSMGGRNFNCMGDAVICTDPASGKESWAVKLEGDLKKEGGFLGAPPAAAGNSLIVTTLKGDVLQLDPANGKVLKKWPTGSPIRFQAAVDGGRVYVGTQDGKLICIDTGDPTLTGWPCWGGNPAHTGVAAK
ncbi:MAG TPA: PQQ-binding-like beta-propeller repeat protein, partial [Gemmataceae bacterium]|nr:PQQ-binding-like beta-propeller repeat protein [Gemmataceae bacterium]